MLNLLIYLLEVSVLTSIFYLFYRYLYFKLAYFEWSRYYFYAVLVISLIIPLLPSLFEQNTISLKFEHIFGSSYMNGSGRINYIKVKDSFLHQEDTFITKIPFIKILLIIWVSGFLRYTFIILRSIISVAKLKFNGTSAKTGKFKIIFTNSKAGCFTFFRTIFVNKEFSGLSDKEQKQILTHEKIHASQLHTIDNLSFELFRAVFWFNPISRLISANIKIIHEFIVDNKLTGNINQPDYSRLILKLATHRSHALTVSSFSSDEIKNRIKLISSPESQKIRKRRFGISIPVLIMTIFASWIILSTFNIYAYDKPVQDLPFVKPFDKEKYKIISPFFLELTPGEVYIGNDNNIDINNSIKISHKEVSYEVKSFSNVYAIESGLISHIRKEDVFGLEELTVMINLNSGHTAEYKGLYKLVIIEGDSIKKGETIGLTGDIRLYPSVDIKLSKNNIALDPEKYY